VIKRRNLMRDLPILFSEKFFLFPKCNNYLTLSDNVVKKTVVVSLKDHNGDLIILSDNLKKTKKKKLTGVLAKINLEIFNSEPESFINSLKNIQLIGIKRVVVKRGEFFDNGGILFSSFEEFPEKKIGAKKMQEITENFVNFLPEILERVRINPVEKIPYMTMMRGNVVDLIDFIVQNSREVDNSLKLKILNSFDVEERFEILMSLPNKKKLKDEIEDETKNEIRKQQEEYYLREQLKIIEKKLGNSNSDSDVYLERLENNPYPDYVKKTLGEEIKKYSSLNFQSGESGVIKQHIETVLDLPWWGKSDEVNNLDFAMKKLDENHYGLEEIKERIIEYLAEKQKAGSKSGQVICFVGPPGVGKTSLAESIAEATGRKFVSISLGGLQDVAEIQGHRKTYVGSMPGRIIQGMKKAGTKNPLFLVDEIDKVSYSFKGDPSNALLEILDPNQNKKFVDNYIGGDLPFDLSEVMFICTANSFEIPAPLLDRMEIIELSSYTENEKLQIAKKHLVPTLLKKTGLCEGEISFEDDAIREIINYYTREAGVRELNRKIHRIIRKFIVKLLKNEKKSTVVKKKDLATYLKEREYDFSRRKPPRVGIVNGLAFTNYGGEILPIEVIKYPKKEGGEFELTGNLGEIMKESGRIALNYIRSNHKEFGISSDVFYKNGIHVHAPEGSTPKEGPSAGIALTSSIISCIKNRSIPSDLGMTGEITSHGYVEPIGGLKEKAIAAHREGIKRIIIPNGNKKDISQIPEEVRNSMEIITVGKYKEV
jgi:ATP-dependent Lon protease